MTKVTQETQVDELHVGRGKKEKARKSDISVLKRLWLTQQFHSREQASTCSCVLSALFIQGMEDAIFLEYTQLNLF